VNLSRLYIVFGALLTCAWPLEGQAQSSAAWHRHSLRSEMGDSTSYAVTLDGAASTATAPRLLISCQSGSAEMSVGFVVGVVVKTVTTSLSDKVVEVRTRRDQREPLAEDWSATEGLTQVVPLYPNGRGDALLDEMQRTIVFRLEVPLYPEGSTVLRFNVQGLTKQLNWLRARCAPRR
jgi:type VI secretion system VasI family protein